MRRNCSGVPVGNENLNCRLTLRSAAKQEGAEVSSKDVQVTNGVRRPLNRIPLRAVPVKTNRPPVAPRLRLDVVCKEQKAPNEAVDEELGPPKAKLHKPNADKQMLVRVRTRTLQTTQVCPKKVVTRLRATFQRNLSVPKVFTEGKKICKEQNDTEISFVERSNLYPVPFADDVEDYSCPDIAFIINERLRTEEQKYLLRRDYLSRAVKRRFSSAIRRILLEWLVRTHAEFHFCSETLHFAIQIFDRYMQQATEHEDGLVRLSILTALYLASKLEETYIPRLNDFVISGGGLIRDTDILAMEVHMCRKLDFDLCAPNSLAFLRRYSKIARMHTVNHCFAKFLLELAVFDPVMIHWRPSFVASCALYVARFVHQIEPYWNECLEFHTGYPAEMVHKQCNRIAKMCTDFENKPYKSVFDKYMSSRCMSIGVIAKDEKVQSRLKKLARPRR